MSDKILFLKSLMQPLSNESSTVIILSYKGLGAGNKGGVTRLYMWTVLVPRDEQEVQNTKMDSTRSLRLSGYMHLIQNPRNCYGNWKATNTIMVQGEGFWATQH